MSQLNQINKIIAIQESMFDKHQKHLEKVSYLKGYQQGYEDAIKKAIQIRCKHDNTLDVGDEDNMIVVCTDCEKVMEDND